jgi:murein DD-endopeptidase MepM/ murein hydrolase activator NlpD
MRLSPLALAVLAACAAPPPPPAPVPAAPVAPRPPEKVVDGSFAFQGAVTQGGLLLGTAPPGAVAVTLDGRAVEMDAERRFLVGFGREAGPRAVVEVRLADGTRVRETLSVAPRTFRVQSIPSLRQSTTPDPAYERLRASEVALIRGARAVRRLGTGWTERFRWPADGRITGVYGSQRILGGVPMNPHFGLDIAAPTGTPIYAPASGTVALASPPKFSLEGNLVLIDHGAGLNSVFIHLSRVDVKAGDVVVPGQIIGAIGTTGRSTGPHLHWAMNWGDVRVDPQLLVPPR